MSSFETSLKIVSIKSLILLLLLSYDKPRVRFPVFPPMVFFPRSMDLLIGVDGEVEDCVDGEVDDEMVLEVEPWGKNAFKISSDSFDIEELLLPPASI